MEPNRSLKNIKFFTERVRQARQSAEVHPHRMVLFFDMRSGNEITSGWPAYNSAFLLSKLRRGYTGRTRVIELPRWDTL